MKRYHTYLWHSHDPQKVLAGEFDTLDDALLPVEHFDGEGEIVFGEDGYQRGEVIDTETGKPAALFRGDFNRPFPWEDVNDMADRNTRWETL